MNYLSLLPLHHTLLCTISASLSDNQLSHFSAFSFSLYHGHIFSAYHAKVSLLCLLLFFLGYHFNKGCYYRVERSGYISVSFVSFIVTIPICLFLLSRFLVLSYSIVVTGRILIGFSYTVVTWHLSTPFSFILILVGVNVCSLTGGHLSLPCFLSLDFLYGISNLGSPSNPYPHYYLDVAVCLRHSFSPVSCRIWFMLFYYFLCWVLCGLRLFIIRRIHLFISSVLFISLFNGGTE